MDDVSVFWLVDLGMNLNGPHIISVQAKSKFRFSKGDWEGSACNQCTLLSSHAVLFTARFLK
jgi:hypothetical protein